MIVALVVLVSLSVAACFFVAAIYQQVKGDRKAAWRSLAFGAGALVVFVVAAVEFSPDIPRPTPAIDADSPSTVERVVRKDARARFYQAGYFKDDDRFRVLAVVATNVSQIDAVVQYARTLPYSRNRTTIAYFYDEPIAWGDSLTMSSDFVSAQEFAEWQWRKGNRWTFFYAKDLVGGESFADCRAEPENPHCRPVE